MGTNISHSQQDTVDPLKKLVVLEFGEKFGKKDFNPVQTIAHTFAKANDCVIYKMRREGTNKLVLEVLTKTRLSPVMNRNPLKEG